MVYAGFWYPIYILYQSIDGCVSKNQKRVGKYCKHKYDIDR